MLVITNLHATNNGKRINVYLDKKFSFSCEPKTLINFNLYTGKSLTKDQVRKIKNADEEERYFLKVLNLISRRPRSSFEIEQYLNRRLYKKRGKDRIIDAIIAKLRKYNYIDDKKFAEWWVENRVKFKPRGKYLIINELKAKGIGSNIIEDVMRNAEIKEEDLAFTLGEKKKRQLGSITTDKNRDKFLRFLLRKGFSYSTAKEVYNRLKTA